jgi:uncharacterized membrane protein (UPF0127 family)
MAKHTDNLLKRYIQSILWFALLYSSFSQAKDTSTPLPQQTITVGTHSIQIEIAKTTEQRNTGLMHRKHLPAEKGMFFVFEHPQKLCFWMKNTLIPLSIAFIDDNGLITDILDMQPLDETPRCSSKEAQYALEVNQGWFDKKQIHIGELIKGFKP